MSDASVAPRLIVALPEGTHLGAAAVTTGDLADLLTSLLFADLLAWPAAYD